MLDNAKKYILEINDKMMDTWYDEKYKFYHWNWHSEITIDDSDWDNMNFVSIDDDYNVLGYISFHIDRTIYGVESFSAINFSDNTIIFGKDLHTVLNDIFTKFNFNRLEFSVIIGNPVEKYYDKLIEKHNGRIIGIRRNARKTMDNQLYDEKIYEILREDYIKSREKNHGL